MLYSPCIAYKPGKNRHGAGKFWSLRFEPAVRKRVPRNDRSAVGRTIGMAKLVVARTIWNGRVSDQRLGPGASQSSRQKKVFCLASVGCLSQGDLRFQKACTLELCIKINAAATAAQPANASLRCQRLDFVSSGGWCAKEAS